MPADPQERFFPLLSDLQVETPTGDDQVGPTDEDIASLDSDVESE